MKHAPAIDILERHLMVALHNEKFHDLRGEPSRDFLSQTRELIVSYRDSISTLRNDAIKPEEACAGS